jgi:CubicO group peptidase (beta-lactamase class C family)
LQERIMKQRIPSLFIVISLLLVSSSSALAQTNNQAGGDPDIDAVVERAMQQHGVPGASVAVVENGELAWVKGYGVADPVSGEPVTPDTVFDVASVAKPVSTWAVMKLVEEGLLDLDAPIEQYVTRWQIPPSEFDHSEITIRRILSHTAGFSEDGDVGVDPGAYVPTIPEALDGAVRGTQPLHVERPPGEDWHYASNAYSFVELAIEEVTGEPFTVYIQREILDPLGMVNSSYEWTSEQQANAAVGHNWYNRPLPQYQYSTRAQGGLLTTAEDLAIFIAASMPGPNGEPVGRGVIRPDSVAETLTPVPFANEAESSHIAGLGYDLIEVDDMVIGARKTGDHRGFKPIIVMDLEHNEGIAIVTNSDRAAIGFVMDVACTWSAKSTGNPLANDCRELFMIRNVQLGLAIILALGVLIYAAWIVSKIRTGRRQPQWNFSWSKAIRIAIPLIILAVWWLLWHTDLVLAGIAQRYPCCGYAVTVRALVPWPTAFVWVSWAVTLWLLIWIATSFVPKVQENL